MRPFGLPLRHLRLTIALVLLVTAVLGAFAATSIRIDSAIENLLPRHDAGVTTTRTSRGAVRRQEATVVAGLRRRRVHAAAPRIDTLTKRLAKIDGVREVMSVTNVKGVDAEDGSVRVGPLMRSLPQTAEDAAALRKRMIGDPLYAGNIVSSDGAATGIVVLFEPLRDEEFLSRHRGPHPPRGRGAVRARRVRDHGHPDLQVEGASVMERDLQRFVPLSIALVVIVAAMGVPHVAGRAAAARRGDHRRRLDRRRDGARGQQHQHGHADSAAAADGDRHRVRGSRREPATIKELEHPRACGRRRDRAHIRVPSSIAWLTTTIGCATLRGHADPAIPRLRRLLRARRHAHLAGLDDLRAGDAAALPDAPDRSPGGARAAPQRVACVGRSLRRAPAASDHGG